MLTKMLSLEDRMNITELLSGLSVDDMLSLSFTITKGLLKPSTKEGEFMYLVFNIFCARSLIAQLY